MRYNATVFLAIFFVSVSYGSQSVERPPVTIWAHGTRQFFTKYFFPNYFFCPPGLNLAVTLSDDLHIKETALILNKIDPERFDLEWFYIFGWSGKLSYKARYFAACDLYEYILELIALYTKKYDALPHIRIITHSHGGNVVLNLARMEAYPAFSIAELILLACPVQEQTKELTKHPLFKRIISLYSPWDTLQIGDPQGLHFRWGNESEFCTEKPHSWFCERLFPHYAHVAQAAIMINGSYLSHLGFLRNQFIRLLPAILDAVEQEGCFGQHSTIRMQTGTRRLWHLQMPLFRKS